MAIFTILAQSQPDLSWPETLKTLVGIVGVLMIVWLIFSVAIAWKKLFGRRPPIQDELDKLEARLHAEIIESYARSFSAADEAKAQVTELRSHLDNVHESLKTAGTKREDTMRNQIEDVRKELDAKISAMPSKMLADLANAINLSSTIKK